MDGLLSRVSGYRKTERVLQACLLGDECSRGQITILSQKKKNLKSYKFYHQTIIQHRWIDEMESLSEMRQNILSSWMETPVPDIV